MTDKKQTALVTGASSGIGRETAIRLTGKGFQVIAAARRLDRLNELAAQYKDITAKQVDLSNSEETEIFCRFLTNLPQPVSVLINNAGYTMRGAIEDVSMEAIKRLFEVNLFALVRITKACLPGMRRMRKGIIVNVSSIFGKLSYPGSGVYVASKYAVEGITDSLRLELAPFGIRVVSIRPGFIATELTEVGNKLAGDFLAKADPDYKPFYEATVAARKKMRTEITKASPELIANLILEAVFSEAPKASYAAGPLSDYFLEKRTNLDDDSFHLFMLEKFGLVRL